MTMKAPARPQPHKQPQAVPTRHEDGSSRTAPDATPSHPAPEGENIDDAGEPWGNNFA